MPAAIQLSRSSRNAFAVRARIGVRHEGRVRAASISRIARVAFRPSISGIWISIRITSKLPLVKVLTAAMPLSAVTTVHPSERNIATAISRLTGWSSASSTRALKRRLGSLRTLGAASGSLRGPANRRARSACSRGLGRHAWAPAWRARSQSEDERSRVSATTRAPLAHSRGMTCSPARWTSRESRNTHPGLAEAARYRSAVGNPEHGRPRLLTCAQSTSRSRAFSLITATGSSSGRPVSCSGPASTSASISALKLAPWPGTLEKLSPPPIISASCRAIARPSPVPP